MKAVPKECCQCREAIRLGTEGLAEQEAHLAVCAECRDYARSVHVTTSALRRLAAQRVSPSPALRARWTAAVRANAQRITWEGNLLGFVQWCRDFLQYNRRPLFALAPVWFLILLLRLFAPSLPDAPAAMVASSPVKVIRQLQAQSQLLAQQLGAPAGKSSTPPKTEPTAPRSQAVPSTRSASTKLLLGGFAQLPLTPVSRERKPQNPRRDQIQGCDWSKGVLRFTLSSGRGMGGGKLSPHTAVI